MGEVEGSSSGLWTDVALVKFAKIQRSQMAWSYAVERSLALVGRAAEGKKWADKLRSCGRVISVFARGRETRLRRYFSCGLRGCCLCSRRRSATAVHRMVPRVLDACCGKGPRVTPVSWVMTAPPLHGVGSPSLEEMASARVWDREAAHLREALEVFKRRMVGLVDLCKRGSGPLSNCIGGCWGIEVTRNYGGWNVHAHWLLLMHGLVHQKNLEAYLFERLGTRDCKPRAVLPHGVVVTSEAGESAIASAVRETLKYTVKGFGRTAQKARGGGRMLCDDLRRVYSYMAGCVLDSMPKFRTYAAFGCLASQSVSERERVPQGGASLWRGELPECASCSHRSAAFGCLAPSGSCSFGGPPVGPDRSDWFYDAESKWFRRVS